MAGKCIPKALAGEAAPESERFEFGFARAGTKLSEFCARSPFWHFCLSLGCLTAPLTPQLAARGRSGY